MARQRKPAILAIPVSILALSWFAVAAGQRPISQTAAAVQIPTDVRVRADRDGLARVIVELRLPVARHTAEGALPDTAAILAQRRAIVATRERVVATLPPANHRVVRRYETIPYVALEVTAAALAALELSPADIVRVMDDAIVRPVLADGVALVEGDQAWASGYDGTGTTIAVLDTGVDASHPFLGGKIVAEVCYSSTVAGRSLSLCPNGLDEQVGSGAAAPCALNGCFHGTHVAGIAAGDGDAAGQLFSGVAKGARLLAGQVFSEILDPASCGGTAPCVAAFTSDVIAALEHVYAVAGQHSVVAVNMSLGGKLFTAACDDEPYKPAIDNLRSIGIATIVASGNSGSRWSIATPACVSSAVSVGAVDRSDRVTWFSNVATFLSLLAPGDAIVSSIPGAGFSPSSGTSMAAPHTAGAWAVLRQAVPGASVATLLSAFRQTGRPVADERLFGMATVPRVRLFQALAALVPVTSPFPSVTAVAPARLRAGMGPATIAVTGTGFNALSTVLWNGAPRPSSTVSTTRIEASLSSSDLSAAGTGQVAVSTPAPGGGSSSTVDVPIDPPPALAVSTTAAATGAPVTVTLTGGLGGSSDWLALAASGSQNTSYVQWTYVGAGATARTWTVTMPSMAGTYEFRLFLNGGYTRAATSPAVAVSVPPNAVPAVTALLPAVALAGGDPFTLTVTGAGFAGASIVRWQGADRPTSFVSATQLRAAIPASDLATAGTAQISVFSPAPGGGLSAALPFTIGDGPTLTVSATSVHAGSSVTMSLAGSPGGPYDWVALASTAAPDTSYLQYIYVGANMTSRTWTVTMPATPGTYEFRLFLNNGYTRAATSPAVSVVPATNPVPTLGTLSPAGAVAGAEPLTLIVTGTGFASSSIVRWNGTDRPTTFVSASQLRTVVSAADLASPGTADVRGFSPPPGGGLSAPLSFNIHEPPILTVSAASVPAGASVTTTLTGGLGGSHDWIALAPTAAANTTYIKYVYVGAGVATRTWTVAMPTTPGTYEFRVFLNNGYTRAATSPAVIVTPN